MNEMMLRRNGSDECESGVRAVADENRVRHLEQKKAADDQLRAPGPCTTG
jgi:hypothetical protein